MNASVNVLRFIDVIKDLIGIILIVFVKIEKSSSFISR